MGNVGGVNFKDDDADEIEGVNDGLDVINGEYGEEEGVNGEVCVREEEGVNGEVCVGEEEGVKVEVDDVDTI